MLGKPGQSRDCGIQCDVAELLKIRLVAPKLDGGGSRVTLREANNDIWDNHLVLGPGSLTHFTRLFFIGTTGAMVGAGFISCVMAVTSIKKNEQFILPPIIIRVKSALLHNYAVPFKHLLTVKPLRRNGYNQTPRCFIIDINCNYLIRASFVALFN
jgi:hypothetical protein